MNKLINAEMEEDLNKVQKRLKYNPKVLMEEGILISKTKGFIFHIFYFLFYFSYFKFFLLHILYLFFIFYLLLFFYFFLFPGSSEGTHFLTQDFIGRFSAVTKNKILPFHKFCQVNKN